MLPSATTRTPMSLAAAIDSDDNELARMRYPDIVRQFYDAINKKKTELEHMICQLLQVPTCRIIDSSLWRSGSFNVAILVRLPDDQDVYLRLPFLHRIGEYSFPGNADEKIRTEAATYLWLQKHCPDVPIPTLYAFGLPNGVIYTRPQNTTWWRRAWSQLNRVLSLLLGRVAPISYTRHSIRHSLSSGFLLISVAQGKKLILSWNEHRDDEMRRENLYRSLSRITMSMNAFPQPRLGAWCLRDNDTIALDNRPLNLYMHMLESEGISSGIPRGRTYAEVDSYLSDLLSLQDAKLRGQPNSISDIDDGKQQLAAAAGMRAVMHHFVDVDTRQGPFYMTLNDIIPNNIFVDEQWNVTCIIDLEWTHTLPAEMQSPPYWLTSTSIDGFAKYKDRQEYDEAVRRYLAVYEEEEVRRNGSGRQAMAQRKAWDSGGFWFFRAATVPRAMFNLFNWHIQPLFNREHTFESIFDEVVFSYWGKGASEFVDKKMEEKGNYVQELSKAYHDIGILE